jgi:hypothetical protein
MKSMEDRFLVLSGNRARDPQLSNLSLATLSTELLHLLFNTVIVVYIFLYFFQFLDFADVADCVDICIAIYLQVYTAQQKSIPD